jgi:hypothetical protein
MRSSIFVAASAIIAVVALAPASAHAATVCVSTTSAIRAALVTADGNGESDEIRIAVGTYAPADGTNAFLYGSDGNFALTISGGWTAGCATQVPGARGTILSGNGARRVLRMIGSNGGTGALIVRNLTISGGESTLPGAGGDFGIVGFAGNIVLDGVIFSENESGDIGGAMRIESAGSVSVRNSVFTFNATRTNHAIAELDLANTTSATRFRFYNNSAYDNGCAVDAAPTCDSAGIHITGGFGLVYNNLFAGNHGIDIDIAGGSVFLDNNQYQRLRGTPTLPDGNVSFTLAQVGFVNELANPPNLRLTEDSPLRNAGTVGMTLSEFDLDGNPREYNRVDMGAYELQTWQFEDGFESQ